MPTTQPEDTTPADDLEPSDPPFDPELSLVLDQLVVAAEAIAAAMTDMPFDHRLSSAHMFLSAAGAAIKAAKEDVEHAAGIA